MSRVFLSGCGAVSPAGWSARDLQVAVASGVALPIQPLPRPGWERPLRMRAVPAPAIKPAFLAHPRLRRSSPITHYAASAMIEAVQGLPPDPARRIGIVLCLQSGCVQYTLRFFEEALIEPLTASPLLFPETVFAAPASHVAALLEATPRVCTLLGDPATFAQGIAMGAGWLRQNLVDLAVVVGAEEINWLRADALWHLEHAAIITGGAGAVALCRDPNWSCGVELADVIRPRSYTGRRSRRAAAQEVRSELAPAETELLCDGLGNSPRADGPETAVWRDWRGPRVSPKLILGEGLMASAAWQCVLAGLAVAERGHSSAIANLVGCNQHASAVRFRAGGRDLC